MNPRERRIAIILGIGVGAMILYYGVNLIFIRPLETAEAEYRSLIQKQNKLKKLVKSERKLARKWKDNAARTFSFKASEAQDLFGQDLKRIAREHGFDSASFKPRVGKRIGTKTGINTVAYRISAVGNYDRAIALLRDIYHTPYLCQITRLTLAPLGPKNDRNFVDFSFTVETPVLPKIRTKVSKLASAASTLDLNGKKPRTSFRQDLPPASHYLALAAHNIFRSYQPPPSNMIMIDNQDYKTVALRVKFYWENRLTEQPVQTVAGKSQKPVAGKGDVVEVTGSYADGEPFGPQKFDFSQRKNWVFKVATHSPAPPAKEITLAVNNQDKDEVFINVVITTGNNKQIRPPTMLIEAKRAMDVGRWTAGKVQVTARYKSGKPAPGGTYLPGLSKQTLIIPPEPAVAVAANQTAPAVVGGDAPPDGRFTVTGLWTSPDTQEMIVTGAGERKVIEEGDQGAVDGGTLLAVHPLGGIVKMPKGHFYLYPLGKSFTERVLLQVQDETELAEAIDMWTRQ